MFCMPENLLLAERQSFWQIKNVNKYYSTSLDFCSHFLCENIATQKDFKF